MYYLRRFSFGRAITLCAGLAGLAGGASAANCVPGTLQSYTALASGCSIGGVQFSSFQLEPVSFTQINSNAVMLTPMMNLGFLVGLNATASAGQTLQSTFSFLASGSTFVTGTVGLIGSSVVPDGANTATGIFNPGGNAIAFDLGGGISALTDSVSLGNVHSVATQLDFVVDGGQSGSASLQQGSVAFSTVPEPSSWILSVSALLGLAWKGRRTLKIDRRKS